MGRYKKHKFDIGDIFGTWKVKKEVNKKKHTYLCECVECHRKKEINKYKLINGIYAPCKACKGIIKINSTKISKYWNTSLNGRLTTNINVMKKYWFRCENNHNFRSTIKDFDLKNCPSCKSLMLENKNKQEARMFVSMILDNLNYNYEDDKENYIVLLDDKLVFKFTEFDRNEKFKKYFENENSYIKIIAREAKIESDLKDLGFEIVKIEVSEDYLKNISTISEILKQKLKLNLTKLEK